MKRYYINFKNKLLFSVLPLIFILNGILFTIRKPDSDGFLEFINEYSYILWFGLGFMLLINAYKITTKKVFLEINEQHIYYNFIGKGIKYDYNDAESYTAKQFGRSYNIIYISKKSGKKISIPLNIFAINTEEFLTLLSKNSKKDIFIKNYGEELKIFERKE